MTRKEIVNSMSLQDAIQVFRDTNAYGTMDIAKTVILKALEQKPCDYYDADNETCRRSEVPKEPCEDAISRDILDKIRDEIEEYKSRQLTVAIGIEDLERRKQIALEGVLGIIDWYKSESEVNERTETHECVSLCDDAISRQAVLDGIEELKKSTWASDKLITEALEDVADLCIKQEPSVTPQTMWIPISERLPLLRGSYKISDDVLITNGYENYMGYLVERKGKIFWHFYGSDIEVGINDEDNDVIAWMPLPEPYKAERSDEWQGITENEDK